MSRLQERAKPLVQTLATGKPVILGTRDQRTLALWCVMAAMNAEFLNPGRTAISPLDRALLMNDRLRTDNWKIWIGNYLREEWVGSWIHNMMPISSKDRVHPFDGGFPLPNTHTTTLVFGRLYVHVFGCEHPDIVRKISLGGRAESVIVQIWPITEANVAWPPEAMTDQDADNLAVAITSKLDEMGRSTDAERFARAPAFPPVTIR